MVDNKDGKHIFRQFDQDLDEIRSRVLKMGGLLEEQMDSISQALREKNSEFVNSISSTDKKINKLEMKIDEECTQVLAKRQPTASDLRLVIATLKSVRDLERIGDEAEKAGELIGNVLSHHSDYPCLSRLEILVELIKEMLSSTLNTFARMETLGAVKNIKKDKDIDEEYARIIYLLIEDMKKNPDNISYALDIMWAARSLERIGDHCINISENVIYHVEGQDVRHMKYNAIKERF